MNRARTRSRRRIFTCRPSAALPEAACARQILSTLARRAYRRPLTAADLAPYLPNNVAIACPAGGTYSINAINVPPTCTVAGHALK